MPWYDDWFGSDAYALVYGHRDEAEAARTIDLVARIADPAPGARILDVGCGRGRHSRMLARRGYDVTGLDLSPASIAAARAQAKAEGLGVTFRVGDMRTPVAAAAFDGVVNLFTAFGYFEVEAEHQRAVDAMAAALRPGGWLVQDYLNAPHVRATLVPEDERTEQGVHIRQRRRIADGRVNKTITLARYGAHAAAPVPDDAHAADAPEAEASPPGGDGRDTGAADVATFHESVALLTEADFARLYARAGLALMATYGTYAGAPHTDASPRLILHAVKAPHGTGHMARG